MSRRRKIRKPICPKRVRSKQRKLRRWKERWKMLKRLNRRESRLFGSICSSSRHESKRTKNWILFGSQRWNKKEIFFKFKNWYCFHSSSSPFWVSYYSILKFYQTKEQYLLSILLTIEYKFFPNLSCHLIFNVTDLIK